MTAYRRSLIKQQKLFHRIYFRRLSLAVGISMIISIGLLVAIFIVYLSYPPITFYASSAEGTGFITELTPLDKPNMTDKYLLPPDPVEEVTTKDLGER